MEAKLLSLAEKYQKEYKWDKAINYFAQYMNEYSNLCNDDIYVSYAKCLRVIGHTNKAKELLMEGRTLHPQSERIVRELHNLYDSLGDWDSAETVANILIEMNPEQANYHFRLGRTYAYLNEYQKAKQVYKTGLKYKHGMPFAKLVKKIQKGFTDNIADVSSEYIFIDGRNNLGAFVHKYRGKKYFTKISRNTRGSRREETFYKKICAEFPILNQTVPQYINSQVLDGVIYLTMEMIDDTQMTSRHVNEIIATSKKISTIKYDDLVETYPNPNYLFILRNRPISIVIFFTQIHKKYYNERLFSSLYMLTKQNNQLESVNDVIRRLESLVMGNHLYLFIQPEKHYSLLHGDFIPQNIKITKQDELPLVFDWATFTIGPHFIDIARYLTTSFIPYEEIKRTYLFNDQIERKLTLIEQIFFLYALILLYLLTSRRMSMETRLTDFIIPALNDMEALVIKFKRHEDGYDKAIRLLFEERNKDEIKVKRLKKEIFALEKERNKFKKLFNDVLNSKSWKITAPLRKLVERIGKNN